VASRAISNDGRVFTPEATLTLFNDHPSPPLAMSWGRSTAHKALVT
jgi:hypothetical protein